MSKEAVMASLDHYFAHLLAFEGGYVNDPVDPGGATNKGVTMQTFTRYAKTLLGVEPTLENLRTLTVEQARKIYKTGYWDTLHCDEIPDQALAEIIFDFYVNAGSNAVRLLQQILKLMEDGVFGPATLRALLAADPISLYRDFKAGRRDYYRRLVKRRPSLDKFLKGWLRRTDSFPDR
jgi:lysozyme family protein